MPSIPVNFVAVAVSTVAFVLIGYLWFGPIFGKPWAKIAGVSKHAGKSMGVSMFFWIASSFVISYVLAASIVLTQEFLIISGTSAGLTAAFWNWFGFVAPVLAGVTLSEKRSWTLWLITASYYLVSMSVAAVILANWM